MFETWRVKLQAASWAAEKVGALKDRLFVGMVLKP